MLFFFVYFNFLSFIKGAPWSEWSSWSECSKTCFYHVDAVGLRRRFRSCNQTVSASCFGDGEEQEPCNTVHCPGTHRYADSSYTLKSF